jgi:cell division protein FtsB
MFKKYKALQIENESLKSNIEQLRAEVEKLKQGIAQDEKDKIITEILGEKFKREVSFYKAIIGVKKNGN